MSKTSKTPGKPGRPAAKPTLPLFARVPADLHEALDEYVKDFRPKTSMGAIIALALEKYLIEVGRWPRPE